MTTNPESLPGFWPEYVPPKSHVSKLVQMPSASIDGYSLSAAYLRDEMDKRKASKDAD